MNDKSCRFFQNQMRRITNKRSRLAWLLLLVYVPMLIALTLHHHDEAQVSSPVSVCQDCAHHVHHDGHISPLQHAVHDCVLCQLQNTPYVAATLILLPAIAISYSVVRLYYHAECPTQRANGINTRAPPYSLIFIG